MALGSSTFANAGAAVSSLFAAEGARQSGSLRAQGIRLGAQGLRLKAQGDLAEAQNYDLAGDLARQNEQFTQQSTAIKQMQQDRALSKSIGQTQADVAGAGFAASGSALDLMRESASEGALTHAVLGQQGLITEAGYEEQAKSYSTMSAAARMASAGEMNIAAQTDTLADQTDAAGRQSQRSSWISAAIQGAAAVGSLYMGNIPGAIALGTSAVSSATSHDPSLDS